MRALLISTYDLGRQPFGLASAAAALTAHGVEVACQDLSRQMLNESVAAASDIVAFFLPMHTATRLALPVLDRIRVVNPRARIYAYGLYAPLNAGLLRERGVHGIIGGEFENDLVACVLTGTVPERPAAPPRTASVPHVQFRIPVRGSLPPLERYASLQVGAERRVAGFTEASRGCKHRCRHCPIVPVYDGRFRVVPIPIVIEDIRTQVAAGARHITFGDPDFLNGPKHAAELVESFAATFPGVTYDVTIKIEHLLQHAGLLPRLAATGCLFITSAVESLDDRVLIKLEKGHTRADVERAAALCRDAGITLAPTFVPFTPWTTLETYCDLLQSLDRLGLIPHVAPIQLAIRLLVTEGSRLLELPDVRELIGPFSASSLTYPWRHPDPSVDALQERLERLVGRHITADRAALFDRVWDDAHAAAGLAAPPRESGALPRAAIPYLNEPWYC